MTDDHINTKRPDADELSRQWTMGKVLIWGDDETHVQSFTNRAIHLDGGGWRLWYSRRNDGAKRYTFGYRDFTEDFETIGETMMRIVDKPSDSGLNIIGVPSEWMLTQPVHLDLPDGRQRIYFWAHASDVNRYLVADSDDGVNFFVADWRRPTLCHPGDRAVPLEMLKQKKLWLYVRQAELPRPEDEPYVTADMLLNDATNVYLLPDGTFELYSAEVIMCPPGPEPHQKDPCVRFIQHRTSADGIHWTPPERVLNRDEKDPYDLQFYYLAVNYTPNGRIGVLGHYRSDPGTGDLEFCYSKDGIHWERQRRPGFPRTKGVEGIYAPHDLVKVNDLYYLFYTGNSINHHGVVSPDAPPGQPVSWIGVATIPASIYEAGISG